MMRALNTASENDGSLDAGRLKALCHAFATMHTAAEFLDLFETGTLDEIDEKMQAEKANRDLLVRYMLIRNQLSSAGRQD